MRLTTSLAMLLLTASVAPALAGAPMAESEVRLSAMLESRLQGALDRRFGQGRAGAHVTARLKLKPEARSLLNRLMTPPEKADSGDERFRWAWLGAAPAPAEKKQFILPGYPDRKARAAEAGGGAESASEPVGPLTDIVQSFGTDIESLTATVVLDAALPESAAGQAEALAQEVLGTSPVRGDKVSVERARLPSTVERAWADPGTAAGLARQAGWISLAAAGLLVLAVLLFLLGRAVRHAADRMASAVQSGANRKLALKVDGAESLPKVLPGSPESAASSAKTTGTEPGEPAPEEPGTGESSLLIDVGVEQVPQLCHLLKDQPPENIALVMPHLSPKVRERFLAAVPAETASAIMLAMVPMRYVEPELLSTLKEELERRVHGVVGGPDQVAEVLQAAQPSERSRLINELRAMDPVAASEVRSRLFLLEDIERLDENSLALLVSEAGIERLALASLGAAAGLREKVSLVLPNKSARVFQETLGILGSQPPDPGKAAEAQESLLRTAEDLLRAGRIRRPPPPKPSLSLGGPA